MTSGIKKNSRIATSFKRNEMFCWDVARLYVSNNY